MSPITCPKCGGITFTNAAGISWCEGASSCGWRGSAANTEYISEEYSSRKRLPTRRMKEITSSMLHLTHLAHVLGYDSEEYTVPRSVYRLRQKVGDIQLGVVTSDSIELIFYPSGGPSQRFPLAQGTVAVTGRHLTRILCSGIHPHVFADIPAVQSGKQYSLLCHQE